MIRRLALIAALGLAPAACATASMGPPPPASAPRPPSGPATPRPKPPTPRPPPKAAPGANLAPILYRCAGGKSFTAAWGLEDDQVRVKAGGVVRTLPAAISASGARYSDGRFEIWGKGDEAMLNGFPGGPYRSCKAG